MLREAIKNAVLRWGLSLLWTSRRLLGLTTRRAGPETLCVIIPVYHRSANVERILQALVLCDFVSEIVVTNNNPAVDIRSRARLRDPRIRLIDQSERRPCCNRFELARQSRSAYFLSMDDDVFLWPDQVLALFEALLREPGVPHGVSGEVYEEREGRLRYLFPLRAADSTEVDILTQVYAFTAAHVTRYFELLERAGPEAGSLPFCDVVISAVAGHPRIHGIGRLWLCPTATEPGVAIWRTPGFMDSRLASFLRVRAARNGLFK